MFELAKFYIDKFKESGKIEVEEIEIEREIFREYLKERSEASVFDKISFSNGFEKRELDLSKIETEIDNLRGLLFELLVFKWLHEMGNYDELKHNYKANKKEKDIDILSKKGNKIYLFECKVTAHKDEDTKEQIRRKVDALRALGYEQIVPILVTYSPLEAMIKESFRKEGIEVQDNFRAKIESLVPEDKRRFVRSIFERDSQDKESGLIELNDE